MQHLLHCHNVCVIFGATFYVSFFVVAVVVVVVLGFDPVQHTIQTHMRSIFRFGSWTTQRLFSFYCTHIFLRPPVFMTEIQNNCLPAI